MQHDFTDPFSDPKTPRSCPTDGSTCTGISGIMDYFEPRPLSWTCCSRHDYTSLFNEYNDLQNWCLEKYVAPLPPPPPPPPPASEPSNCWDTCIEVSTIFSAPEIAKMSISKLLNSHNLISRKIWVKEKSWNFYTLSMKYVFCTLFFSFTSF